MDNPVIYETSIGVSLVLSPVDIDMCINIINKHFTGDAECNIYIDGKLKPKYPEIEKAHPEWVTSHRNLAVSQQFKIPIEVYLDGTFDIKQNTSLN